MANQAINDLIGLLGAEKVLTDESVLLNAEGPLTRPFERAFGYQPKHLPIAVVKAMSTEDVSKTLKYCNDNKISVITKTGATCSEDQLIVINDSTIFLDCEGMNQLIKLDAYNMMATVGCGMHLARLEELANEQGLTTGHCPQSQPLACLGGLTATRSIGQFSTYYGGIEDLVCGLEAVLPNGEVVRIRNVPRRSAGPDLRHMFIGSEGALAVITELTVKLFTYYPDDFWKGAFVVKSFEEGIDAIREIITKGFRPSVVRLYDKPDMDLNYGSVELAEGEACMFFVAEGPADIARVTGENIMKIAEAHGARWAGTQIVDHWLATRNNICNTIGGEEDAQKFRETKTFYATCEISASWSEIKDIYRNVMEKLPQNLENLVLLGGHVSHSYQTGTNVYFVYQLKATDPLKMNEDQWELIDMLCKEVLAQPTGGAMHHHGTGKVRVKLMHEEHGSSYPLMVGLKHMMDPNGIMNPGTLILQE